MWNNCFCPLVVSKRQDYVVLLLLLLMLLLLSRLNKTRLNLTFVCCILETKTAKQLMILNLWLGQEVQNAKLWSSVFFFLLPIILPVPPPPRPPSPVSPTCILTEHCCPSRGSRERIIFSAFFSHSLDLTKQTARCTHVFITISLVLHHLHTRRDVTSVAWQRQTCCLTIASSGHPAISFCCFIGIHRNTSIEINAECNNRKIISQNQVSVPTVKS